MAQMYEAKKLMQTIRKMYELPTEYRVQVMAAISRMGAVDAEPVAQGRWKGAGLGDYYCSLCLETVGGNSYTYCPHCGAKMDK